MNITFYKIGGHMGFHKKMTVSGVTGLVKDDDYVEKRGQTSKSFPAILLKGREHRFLKFNEVYARDECWQYLKAQTTNDIEIPIRLMEVDNSRFSQSDLEKLFLQEKLLPNLHWQASKLVNPISTDAFAPFGADYRLIIEKPFLAPTLSGLNSEEIIKLWVATLRNPLSNISSHQYFTFLLR